MTGAGKVNLIGYSQGVPTTRYVAVMAPQLVASVTSVGGVNKGSRVADIVRGVVPSNQFAAGVFNTVGGAFVSLINVASDGTGLPQSATAALDSLTTPHARWPSTRASRRACRQVAATGLSWSMACVTSPGQAFSR